MTSSIESYDYDLPSELIAQKPAEPRDSARLMILDRSTNKIEHKKFFDIADELREGDVLVLNQSKVFKARLKSGKVEIFLLRARDGVWEALVKPGRKVKIGDVLDVDGMSGTIQSKEIDGTVTIAFDRDAPSVIEFANQHGEVPLPPYIATKLDRLDDYQTVYAKETGSVAAPTAGLHFTPELLKTLEAKGVQIEYITLHVGIGTFQPVRSDTLEEHRMHSEFVEISEDVARRIRKARSEDRRIIAVGTTTTRALEGSGVPAGGYVGDVNIFIKPGFEFKVVDSLITNFHLPKTTLLVLVSTFAGHELTMRAYAEAIKQKYRFFSFGDAMFIR